MALTHLPRELLINIITHVLPEGFESMALTCRKLYALCRLFIQGHNRLRSEFSYFYYGKATDQAFPTEMAFDLIKRIAVEPIVARYIRHADFGLDGFGTTWMRHVRRWPSAFNPALHGNGAVIRLLANSPYLEQIGVSWQEYYTEIAKDLQAACYSPRATAFLLTLLPNVETLILPLRWKPLPETDKLVNAVVCQARQSHHFPFHTRSLAQTTTFWPCVWPEGSPQFDLAWTFPFLALPRLRYFCGQQRVAIGDGCHKSIYASKDLYPGGFGATLREVEFVNCCMDEVAIAGFLKHTIRLKKLHYSHSSKDNGYDHWDICKFVMAIQREVGSHLEVLSVSILKLRGLIVPGRASMRAFRRLRELTLPLEIAMCNITATGAGRTAIRPSGRMVVADSSTETYELDDEESSMSELVPSSVFRLSLLSRGTEEHAKALDVMFRHFAARKGSMLPALKEIWLYCPASADDAYEEQCAKVLAETEKAGVVLRLRLSASAVTMKWDAEE